MHYEMINARLDDKGILSNLLQFYIYDFSEFIDVHVEENGKYSDYPLNDYWAKDNHFPYLIKVNGYYAGFALVKRITTESNSYYSISEFFIMKKYRRTGLGKSIAKDIFGLHKGKWEVFQMVKNKPAQLFWRNVIKEYTNGNFTERIEEGRLIQEFTS